MCDATEGNSMSPTTPATVITNTHISTPHHSTDSRTAAGATKATRTAATEVEGAGTTRAVVTPSTAAAAATAAREGKESTRCSFRRTALRILLGRAALEAKPYAQPHKKIEQAYDAMLEYIAKSLPPDQSCPRLGQSQVNTAKYLHLSASRTARNATALGQARTSQNSTAFGGRFQQKLGSKKKKSRRTPSLLKRKNKSARKMLKSASNSPTPHCKHGASAKKLQSPLLLLCLLLSPLHLHPYLLLLLMSLKKNSQRSSLLIAAPKIPPRPPRAQLHT